MDRLTQFLREDRQWPRRHRLAHAEYQMQRAAEGSDEFKFWQAVKDANDG